MFAISKKRKHEEEENTTALSTSLRKRSKPSKIKDAKQHILQLEAEILRSRKNYNNINELITILKEGKIEDEKNVLPAAFSLCHVFKVLMPRKVELRDKDMPENEKVIAQWLSNKHKGFVELLLERLEGHGSKSQVGERDIIENA